MYAGTFIARRIKSRERLAVVAIAVSFLVMIVAVAISAGFRAEIRRGVSSLTGDVMLTDATFNYYGEENDISRTPSYLEELENEDGVESITAAAYRAGIVRGGSDMAGAVFKGTETGDSTLQASIPSKLADKLGLRPGDKMTSYFIGEKVKARNFTVKEIYDSPVEADDAMIVHVPIEDIQRLNGWDSDRVSALEVHLDDRHSSRSGIQEAAGRLGSTAILYAGDEDDILVATSAPTRYARLFDWLDLIDFNVGAILLLMTIVAGFNMISGLLILLLRNTAVIGTLKALGMTTKGIAEVFLKVSARIVLRGMAIGNAVALLFCAVQGLTHAIKLNPANYFVSFVPVRVNVPGIIAADIASFAIIMLLLLLPSTFIAKVDPAETMRSE